MPEHIIINGRKVGRGQSVDINLNIARLPTYTNIDLPVRILRAEEDGPVLLLTGGLHGDEINGIEIVRRLVSRDLLQHVKGTIIAIPLVNVYGFIQSARGLPDGKDINRSFPGSKGGSLAKLVAYTLMNQIIPQIDLGIDFHTGGASRANFPQIRCTFNDPFNLKIAKAFAPPLILNSGLINKSFRKAADRKKKKILVFETGEAHRFDESGIQEGINGTLRVMQFLKMRNKAPEGNKVELYSKSMWVRARYAGLFQPLIRLGDTVKKRQHLGKITDPFGFESFKIIAPGDGRVIGLNFSPVVHKGDAVMHIATSKETI